MRKTAFIAILSLSMIAGCGGGSGNVEIRVHTPFETRKNFKNLMDGIASVAVINPAASCKQHDLVAGVVANPGRSASDVLLETTRLDLTTNYFNAPNGNYVIDPTWMASNIDYRPVSLLIPRGVLTGVGIVGSMTATGKLAPNGVDCAEFNPTSSPYDTYSFAGHRDLIASGPQDISLNVYYVNATATPSVTPSAGEPICGDPDDNGQNCPTVNFYAVNCSGAACPNHLFKFQYAWDRKRLNWGVSQWLNGMPVAGTYSIPEIKPILIGVYNLNAPLVELDSIELHHNDFSGYPIRTAVADFTPRGLAATVTVTERMKRLPPPLQPFARNPLGHAPNGDPIFSWNWVPGASYYYLQYDTIGNNSYGTAVTTSGGVTHFNTNSFTDVGLYNFSSTGVFYHILIYATDGITTSAATAEYLYQPVGTISAPTFADNTSLHNFTISWTQPTAASQSQALIYNAGTSNLVTNYVCGVAAGSTCTTTAFAFPTGNQYDIVIQAYNGYGGMKYTTSVTHTAP